MTGKRELQNDTLALCAMASAKLFAAQQWAWARRGHPYSDENLYVPDAESILRMLTELVEGALASQNGRAGSGRLHVEVCPDVCYGCDGRCVQVFQHLGEVVL